MRDVINKNVTEEDLLGTVRQRVRGRLAARQALLHDRPAHRDRRGRARASASWSRRCFTTAREATPPASAAALRDRGVGVDLRAQGAHAVPVGGPDRPLRGGPRASRLLRESMPRKGVDLHWHDAEVSFLEGVMARGGRELADADRDGVARVARASMRGPSDSICHGGSMRSRRPGSTRRPSRTASGTVEEPLPWDAHLVGRRQGVPDARA